LSKPQLPAASRFVDRIRDLYESEPDPGKRWAAIREAMIPLLVDPGLKESSKRWPLTVADAAGGVRNLLFYEDPDYGFVINALIKNPGGYAMIHDHGPSWTIYGVLRGEERIVHYDAAQRADGKFDMTEKHADICRPGDVDVVPPRLIHSEYAGAEKSIAVIVRSQRSGTFEQFRYLEDGSQVIIRGPDQAPYALS